MASTKPQAAQIGNPNDAVTVLNDWTFGTAATPVAVDLSHATVTQGGSNASNVGTQAANVSAAEFGNGVVNRTVLTLTALPIALSHTNVGGGTLIYTFPVGRITILDASASVAETTTSTIASTLHSGSTLSVGVGSVQTTTQASGTLATTEQDIVNAFSATSSTTINVAGAVAVGRLSATTTTRYDGTSSAIKAFLNCGVPTAGNIAADATSTWTGTVSILWSFDGTI